MIEGIESSVAAEDAVELIQSGILARQETSVEFQIAISHLSRTETGCGIDTSCSSQPCSTIRIVD